MSGRRRKHVTAPLACLSLSVHLARLAAVGYMLCFCFLFIYLVLTIPVRPIISKSTGPIFAKRSGLVEQWLWMINLKLIFRSLKEHCSGNQNLLVLVHGCHWI